MTIGNDITLNDFAKMVRMSSDGTFKTSIDKTAGSVYVDSKGSIHNVSHKNSEKGNADNNVKLRQQFVAAFAKQRASAEFLSDLREALGLSVVDGRGEVALATAFQPLSRREVKRFLTEFNACETKVTDRNGEEKIRSSFDMESAEIRGKGSADGFTVVNDKANLKADLLQLAKNELATLRKNLQEEAEGNFSLKRQFGRLERSLENASPKELERLVEGFRKGNVDPLPFGRGPHKLDFTSAQTQAFKDWGSGFVNSRCPYSRGIEMLQDEVNGGWTISFGGEKLPNKSVKNQDVAIRAIVDKFFENENNEKVRGGSLLSCGELIYTNLSSQIMDKLPGSVVESKSANVKEVKKEINVSRSEEGNMRVTFKVAMNGIDLVTSKGADGKLKQHRLDNPGSSYRVTTVTFDVIKGEDGKLGLKIVDKPQIEYNYSKLLEPEKGERHYGDFEILHGDNDDFSSDDRSEREALAKKSLGRLEEKFGLKFSYYEKRVATQQVNMSVDKNRLDISNGNSLKRIKGQIDDLQNGEKFGASQKTLNLMMAQMCTNPKLSLKKARRVLKMLQTLREKGATGQLVGKSPLERIQNLIHFASETLVEDFCLVDAQARCRETVGTSIEKNHPELTREERDKEIEKKVSECKWYEASQGRRKEEVQELASLLFYAIASEIPDFAKDVNNLELDDLARLRNELQNRAQEENLTKDETELRERIPQLAKGREVDKMPAEEKEVVLDCLRGVGTFVVTDAFLSTAIFEGGVRHGTDNVLKRADELERQQVELALRQ